MNRVNGWIAAGLLAVSTPAHAEGISGTYVGSGSDIAVLLQVVESNGGQLAGRYEQVVLRSGTKLDRMNASVKGNSDGRTVVLEIKPTEVLSGTLAVSGTISGSVLRLSGGGYGRALNLTLSKATEAEFQLQITRLTNHVEKITETQNLEKELARSENLIKKMTAFSSQANVQLRKFPVIEQRFRAITGVMSNALTQQRSLFPGDQTARARSQISVAISQAGTDANQLHVALQTAYSDFDEKARTSIKDAEAVYQSCQNTKTSADRIPQLLVKKWNSSCLKLPNVAKEFIARANDMRRSYAQTEATWQEEHRKQKDLISSSDIAAR